MKDNFWLKSYCCGSWLHRYEIIRVIGEEVEERCTICKDTQIFKMNGGNIGNLDYIDYHLRQMLPKQHPFYQHEYKR